ncbi:MAG: antibiotic biosynthesis monooxygenase [Rhodospirillales bacterium]|nr:antibiotic biosynthesis monooxygenase [Alphaproteobacteria bacterium]MBL6947809.1 antibiotic biosynthesis monooxygenase [Rhodospirillales bacterium]
MERLAEQLTPPYYAATLNERRDGLIDEDHIAPADEMVTLATRQPGFLGLESSRDKKGNQKTISYWKDVGAIEEWITAGDDKINNRFGIGLAETCGIEISYVEDHIEERRDRRTIRGINAFVAAAISSLTGFLS